jgi:hypothetical protein
MSDATKCPKCGMDAMGFDAGGARVCWACVVMELEAEVARLKAALKPFADVAWSADPSASVPDGAWDRAAAALGQEGAK